LSGTTNKFASEFASASDWLKFGLHSHNKNSNYSQTSAEYALTDYTTFTTAILNITGTAKSIDRCPRLGNFLGNSASLLAFRDAPGGIKGLLSAYDTRDSYGGTCYDLSRDDTVYVYNHGYLYRPDTYLHYFCTLSTLETSDPTTVFASLMALNGIAKSQTLIWMMHEYAVNGQDYGYSQYDRDTMFGRLETACSISKNNNYVFKFPMNIVL
jgi:hypothetical protein